MLAVRLGFRRSTLLSGLPLGLLTRWPTLLLTRLWLTLLLPTRLLLLPLLPTLLLLALLLALLRLALLRLAVLLTLFLALLLPPRPLLLSLLLLAFLPILLLPITRLRLSLPVLILPTLLIRLRLALAVLKNPLHGLAVVRPIGGYRWIRPPLALPASLPAGWLLPVRPIPAPALVRLTVWAIPRFSTFIATLLLPRGLVALLAPAALLLALLSPVTGLRGPLASRFPGVSSRI